MKTVIVIQNRTTGVQSPMDKKEWDRVKNTDMWKDVFDEVTPEPIPQDPPEVADLKAKQAEQPPPEKRTAGKTGIAKEGGII